MFDSLKIHLRRGFTRAWRRVQAFRAGHPRAVLYALSVGLTLVLWGILAGPAKGLLVPPSREAIVAAQVALSAVGLPVFTFALQLGSSASPWPLARALVRRVPAGHRVLLSFLGLAIVLLLPDPYLGVSVLLVTAGQLGHMYLVATRTTEAELEGWALEILAEDAEKFARGRPRLAFDLINRLGYALMEAIEQRRLARVAPFLEALERAMLNVLPVLVEPDRIWLVLNNECQIRWWLERLFGRLMKAAVQNDIYSSDVGEKLLEIGEGLVGMGCSRPDLPLDHRKILVALGLTAIRASFREDPDHLASSAGSRLAGPAEVCAQQFSEEILKTLTWLLTFCVQKHRPDAFRALLGSSVLLTRVICPEGLNRWLGLVALVILYHGNDSEKFSRYFEVELRWPAENLAQAGAALLANPGQLIDLLYDLLAEVNRNDFEAAGVGSVLLAGAFCSDGLQTYSDRLGSYAQRLRDELNSLRKARPAWFERFQSELAGWAQIFGEAGDCSKLG